MKKIFTLIAVALLGGQLVLTHKVLMLLQKVKPLLLVRI